MKLPIAFFENVNELAYVSDMDSYEILHMNQKAMKTYGISSIDELKGKKCYEVFYGNSVPCASCNNKKLSEGEFIEWKYYNPVLDKYLLLMDTMANEDGRRCRFEFAVDISENEYSRQMLDRHEGLETRINVNIKHAICEPDPDKSIEIILEFLGRELSGERAYVFEKNSMGGDDNTYEWTAAGVIPEKENLQNVPPEVCANWYRYFNQNKNIMYDDIEKIRYEDPLVYETLKNQDIHSIAVVPLFDENQILGFCGVDNPPKQNLQDTLNMLQILGYFISSMLKRRDMMNQLREMSLCDQLTKLGNRHAMEEYIVNVQRNKGIGIVYCDITGLKRTNDTLGHKMGDQLICHAAESLKSAFGDYGLFRIGGDELLAICVDIDEETLQSRIELLRKKAVENSVNLAIGAIREEPFESDLQKLMSAAEQLMYQEKNEYYRAAGIDRRR